MGRRNVLTLALLAAVTLSLVSAAAAQGHTKSIQIGGEETVTASVSNPLQVPDVLRVEFNGEALNDGIVSMSLPADARRVDCTSEENACRVTLGAGEERQLSFPITGESEGQSQFTVSVISETTEKQSEATIEVVVNREESGAGESSSEERGGGLVAFLTRLLGMS